MSLPATIKALKTQDGPKVAVVDVPFGTLDANKHLGPNSVISRTLAVGLNPTDWKHAIGPWNPPGKSNVVGCDSAGEVVAVGSNVTHVKKGDRIFGFVFGTSDPYNGSYAEYVRFDKGVVAKIPDSMSDVEAASFPIPHLTAVQYLYLRLNLSRPSSPSTEGKTILVWGGATAVGHHAVQLAALSGYKVLTTASPANHERLLALGATACFNYRDADVVEQIKTHGQVFAAIDCVSEKGSTEACIDAIGSSGGRVVCTLPVTPEIAARRSDVKAEFALVYTELGYDLTFANAFHFPAIPGDNKGAEKWNTEEVPALLAGWNTTEGGSPRYKAQKLRMMKGGLDHIVEGLEIMRDGGYAAEKIVYSLA